MSGFLARWSRRKAAAERAAPPDLPSPDLPAIDSLSADSDFSAFLARGVPSAVQSQALRVAWRDPAIADFRGMAEYAWDFNAPDYGAMAATDDVAAWVGQIVRSAIRPQSDPPAVPPSPPVVTTEPRSAIAGPGAPAPGGVQGQSPWPSVPVVRRHGGAMPT